MIEEILALRRTAEYDFRRTANPDDPLRHLFEDWVPYYKLKWAIARVLAPRAILEIGVRFGYSAAAFLDACPEASYLGIDNDSEEYGGQKGAVEWARRITAHAAADYVIADSQRMKVFPGDRYDLIHVDGQQDCQGYVNDLKRALRQGRYVLVDGYFWTRDNLLNASEFLFRYRDLIESYFVIPEYAGELLIKPKALLELPSEASISADAKDAYSTDYYLSDCGGWEEFKRDHGAGLSDNRLRAVGDLAAAAPIGPALDLGCGRGELAVYLAGSGRPVLAVDYSPDAIALAKQAADGSTGRSPRIEFYCGSVNDAPLNDYYTLAVASDLVEHLSHNELDCLYERISAHLTADGLFVIHTFPNLWYYRFGYARRLREAKKLGAYLPITPRSRYEELLHINEQSPPVLRRQLQAHFPHVVLWFSDHALAEPFDNLSRRFSRREMQDAGDLFAIASHSPIDVEGLRERLQMFPLPRPFHAAIKVCEVPATIDAGSRFQIIVEVQNDSSSDLKSAGPNPVHLSYHSYRYNGALVQFDGIRTRLPVIHSRGTAIVTAEIQAPYEPGEYRFRLALVQESVFWSDEPPENIYRDAWVKIVG